MQRFLIFFIVFNFISCKGDANSDDPIINPVTPPDIEEKVIFDLVSVPPTIDEIDESDYILYYVDNSLGNDNNTGLSEDAPVKSLDKAAIIARNLSAKILLKSGEIFQGPFLLSNLSSTESNPLIIDSYGGDAKPTIDGAGSEAAVNIQDDNIRFRNIDIINKTGKIGISIIPQVAGAFKNIQITGCRIEEVNWLGSDILYETPKNIDVYSICPDNRYEHRNAGISLEAKTSVGVGASWFENIYITNNEIHKVARVGIWLCTQWGRRPGLGWGNNTYISDNDGWFPSKNIVVQGNNISYTGGDAVVLIATKNSFIDHNTVFHADYLGRTGFANAGIWPHSSINFTMQYNEVAYTHLEHGVVDGEGIDVDIACVNTLVQFNYVHHNDGGGILLCNYKSDGEIGNHQGTIIRNNVFYDNGIDVDKGAFLTTSSAVKEVSVYNNLVVASDRLSSLTFVLSADWAQIGKNENFTFKNNIFVGTVSVNSRFDVSQISYCNFNTNLFYQVGNKSIINNSQQQLYYNPEINMPDNYDGYDKALMFRPQNSNVFTDGLVFSGMLNKDMEGNDVEGVNYLGAFSK